MRAVGMMARVPVLAAGLAALGCSPASAPSSTGNAGLTVQQACADVAYARCTQLATCSVTASQFRYGSDPNACRADFEQVCMNLQTAPSTGATPASSEACAQAINNGDWPCNEFLFNQNIPPACAPFMGTLGNGASCADNQQCSTGYCQLPTNQACGTCQPAPDAGASCAQYLCPVGLVCEGSTLTCAAYANLGSMCNSSQPCNEGLTCVSATSTASGICERGVMSGMGAACVFTGAGCDYYSGLVCNAKSSTCQTAQLAPPGQACGTVADQSTTCLGGTCVRGACAANIPTGEPCNSVTGGSCVVNARCIVPSDGGTEGTCQFNGSTACP